MRDSRGQKLVRGREERGEASRRDSKRARGQTGAAADARTADKDFRAFASQNAYSRHEMLMQHYARVPACNAEAVILRDKHEFVRDETKDATDTSWETRVAVKYYRRLFKEYALADLSRYKESKVGLRWRTEKEVIVGKGQFVCGNKRCDSREDLHSYEVPFRYEENRQRKLELVKVRVCPKCARKLFYEKIKQLRRADKQRRQQSEGEDSGDEGQRRQGRAEDQQLDEGGEESGDDDVGAEVHEQIQQLIVGGSTKRSGEAVSNQGVGKHEGVEGDTASSVIHSEGKAAMERKAWLEPHAEERTRDDDIDDYFQDLFM